MFTERDIAKYEAPQRIRNCGKLQIDEFDEGSLQAHFSRAYHDFRARFVTDG